MVKKKLSVGESSPSYCHYLTLLNDWLFEQQLVGEGKIWFRHVCLSLSVGIEQRKLLLDVVPILDTLD